MRGAHVLPGIREKPGDGLVFKNAHVDSPPFHRHLAAPAAAAPAAVASLLKATGVVPLLEGSWVWGSSSGGVTQGLDVCYCFLTSSRRKPKFP